MCGILFSILPQGENIDPGLWDNLVQLNVNRGPDAQQSRHVHLESEHGRCELRFFSSVLHLRGPETVEQPLVSPETGNILCWNGEIFGGLNIAVGENDTVVLMQALERSSLADDPSAALSRTIAQIEGPFAFVFWQAARKTLWFGRDCLGRRSLLWHRPTVNNGHFMLSSVGLPLPNGKEPVTWEEVPADGLYTIKWDQVDFPDASFSIGNAVVHRIPWVQNADMAAINSLSLPLPFPKLNTELPSGLDTPVTDESSDPVIGPAMADALKGFIQVLDISVKNRVADIPYIDASHCHARVAILFSGGLDCICLAALVHKHLPLTEPIDLLNVAFENPRSDGVKQRSKQTNETTSSSTVYETPDRKTGKNSVEELRRIAPGRTWNFVEINIPYQEATSHRQEIIERMYPLDTVMDLSIAMAFWFAARGKGKILVQGHFQDYESRARVLISGLGADEQLGGYSRHREAFRRGGWERLLEETQLDVDRISTRNLGRDDRIISDHGKEARFPFLCTNVVRYLCNLPIWLKMDMRYNRGIGEKLILRHMARHLGLVDASHNWKRAIQFGAKTAKMTSDARSEKGQHKLIHSVSHT